MFTATLWMIYIKTAMHLYPNIYLLENHRKNKHVSFTHIGEQTKEPVTNFDKY